MLIDIIEVKPLSPYKLFIRFEDGSSGNVDIAQVIPFEGVFAVLADKDFFATVHVNPEIGTICWENGLDLSPCVLYDLVNHISSPPPLDHPQ